MGPSVCVLMGEGLYGWSKLQGTGAGLAYQESQSTVCLVKKAHTLKAIIIISPYNYRSIPNIL